ncbi:hypothetical protein THAOC_03461, partial [Thalassiosira oceanica]
MMRLSPPAPERAVLKHHGARLGTRVPRVRRPASPPEVVRRPVVHLVHRRAAPARSAPAARRVAEDREAPVVAVAPRGRSLPEPAGPRHDRHRVGVVPGRRRSPEGPAEVRHVEEHGEAGGEPARDEDVVG